ncbi:hypothetical protein BUALT_Bualt04G0179000 [Buddleja alternifolia]|uniref:Uncharacterized protein n=1 Tax=Buddleja alternifolia TaxID=168488 RepID=A0AAV6XPV5_9LAMI|nr:hypothetical protein BUALT_Bualt04G0179000 [Buddleja alternifolia]
MVKQDLQSISIHCSERRYALSCDKERQIQGPICIDESSMANMRKVEEGSAFPEKRKLDLPNSINKSREEKEEVKEEDKPNPTKKQKLTITPENVICSYVIDDKVVESKDGKENCKADENENKDEHYKVEPETVNRDDGITMVDKGKGILIEESDEEADEDDDDDSSDDSDSDFSDGLDTHSEDDAF